MADVEPDLEDRIAERIRLEGPMTFAAYMDMALYDPRRGFYARGSVGETGDFVTSPHVSPVFGRLLARFVEEAWDALGRRERFAVVEAGAGDGTLAEGILAALPAEAAAAVDYVAAERSAAGRARIEARGLRAVASIHDVPVADVGCLLANELLDNLPFHRLRGGSEGPGELFVGLDRGRLALQVGPLSSPALAEHARDLGPGDETIVSLDAVRFFEAAAARFRQGFVLLVDYGDAGDRRPEPWVHGYRGHRVEEDVLEAPGTMDITAGVDFATLVQRAEHLGLRPWGPVSQREVLLALGFRELEARARARQVEALDRRRGVDALRIYSNRNRANLLLAQPGLGDFLVLCIGVGVEDPPPSMERALELARAGAAGGTRSD